MNQYEKGKHRPDPNTVAKICEVLRIPAAYLFCEDDDLARIIAIFKELNSSDRKKIIDIVAQHESQQ